MANDRDCIARPDYDTDVKRKRPYARRGQDWATQLRQRAKERALMDELGLSIDAAQPMDDQVEEEQDAETPQQSA